MAKRKFHNYNGVDLAGERHGRLKVIRKADKGITQWVCKCDCGNEVTVTASKFFIVQSCGCFERENQLRLKFRKTHGMTETRLYGTWCGVKDRCLNPNAEHYDRYGGRGICVCDEWIHSFEAFRDWAIKAGYDETLTGKEQSLDRINVDGNYCPENCRWISMKQQARNRKDTVYIESEKGLIPARQFAEENKITDYVYLYRKIKKGENAEKILSDWAMKTATPDSIMDLKEATSFYGVNEYTIRSWIKSGKLKAEKYGQKWYIPKGQTVTRKLKK